MGAGPLAPRGHARDRNGSRARPRLVLRIVCRVVIELRRRIEHDLIGWRKLIVERQLDGQRRI